MTSRAVARPTLLPLGWAVPVAAAAGLALDASFPALGWWPLAFVAVIGGLITSEGRSVGGAVLVGAAFGFAFFLPHVSWSAQFLGDHPLRWVPWVALATVQTVFWAVLTPLVTLAQRWLPRWRTSGVARLVLLPLLVAGAWMTRELVMGSWPYGGFPWGRLGMSQSASPVATVASWLGVSGLGFLMVTLCAALIEAVRSIASARPGGSTEPSPGGRISTRWPALAPAAGLAAALLLLPQFPTSAVGTMRVGAVQGNGPAAYVDQRARGEILDSQLAASTPLEEEEVDLVLWPEGGVDSDPVADPATAAVLDDAARRYDAPLLLNAASGPDEEVRNTSFVWTTDGPQATHAKRHPVPFGEYIPNREFYGAIVPDLVNLLQREYVPGTDSPVVAVDDARVGLAICFDVVFDDVIREGARDGAEVLMFQTNNADFRGTDENAQQLAFARMRAVETGRSVVNLSTTGTSQVFAPDGTMIDHLPADEPGLMIADVERREGRTAGVVLGPWVQGLIAGGTVAALAALAIGTRRPREPASGD